jgi:AcrR family transcriptional regulator
VSDVVRPGLSRERIVGEALGLIEERGIKALSMRELGARLDVEAMSLYRYVHSRESLLDLVVETVLAELAADPDVLDHPVNGWQDFLQRLATGLRRIALVYPQTFPLLASRPPAAPWIRPPLRSLRWIEAFMDGMLHSGFSRTAAVDAYRAFTSFLLGHLLLEVAAKGADFGPLADDGPQHEMEGVDLSAFPVVRELAQALAEDHSKAEFEESLENLMDRIELIRSQR